MKIAKMGLLCVALTIGFAGLASAAEVGHGLSLQQLGKRPFMVSVAAEQADAAWVGASMQTQRRPDAQLMKTDVHYFRQQLNLQFVSKRPWQVI